MLSYIIDLDGTMYRGSNPLPYAIELVELFHQTDTPYLFFTNAPEICPSAIEEKLHQMRIPVRRESVISAGVLSIEYLCRLNASQPLRIFMLASPYLKKLAQESGLCLDEQSPNCVFVAFSPEICLEEIHKASYFVQQGALFIASNPDPLIPTETGNTPHTGFVSQGITMATGKKPLIVGKPSGNLQGYFTEYFKTTPDNIVVLGDRLDTDMQFARNCGFNGYLLLTGSTSAKQLDKQSELPDGVFHSLKEVYQLHHLRKEVSHDN